MAGTLKSLLVKLGVDSKGFDKGMDSAEKRTGNLTKGMAGMAKVGGGILLGAAVGVGALAAGLASSVGPASDLEESINAVRVVFEEGADEIIKFGESSAIAVGLSSREFGQLSAEMGAMLGNVGIAQADLAGETINLVERASDMASIFNTDVTQAFAAIQSAIKGEFNPLEQFGVKMNMAMINAKALSMGLVETSVDTVRLGAASIKLEKALAKSAEMTKEFGADSLEAREAIASEATAQAALEKVMEGAAGTITDAAKAQAALALVYEQTDKVAGDFQNTSAGLANSQRILKATLEDTKAKIGAALLPAMESLAKIIKDIASSPEFKAFLDKVVEGVANLSGWIERTVPVMLERFKELKNFFEENKGVVVAIFAVMGVAIAAFVYITVIPALIALWTAMWPILAIMAAVAAVAFLVHEAWTNNWGGIQEKVAKAKDWIIKAFNTLKTVVVRIWNKLMTVLGPIFDAFRAAFEGDWFTFGQKIREAWDNVWAMVKTALSTAFTAIKTAVKNFIPRFKSWFQSVNWRKVGLDIIKGIARGITSAVGWIKSAAKNAVRAAWNAAKGFLRSHSESKLFGELGRDMMLGMAGGIGDFAKVPVSVTQDVTRNIATTAGRGAGGSASEGYLRQMAGQKPLDEVKLSRLIRDAILQVSE